MTLHGTRFLKWVSKENASHSQRVPILKRSNICQVDFFYDIKLAHSKNDANINGGRTVLLDRSVNFYQSARIPERRFFC
jgi:hypothetical protein